MFIAFVIGCLFQAAVPALPTEVARLSVSAPVAVVELDASKLQGEPARLGWSPDGSELYVRAVKTDVWGNERSWHYLVNVAEKKIRPVESEPLWFGRYWAWKSGQAAPGVPDLKIEWESREEIKRATGTAREGTLGQNVSDPTGPGSQLGGQGGALAQAAAQAQKVTTTTFRLKGELVAEFVNTRPVAGLTFSWAPAGAGILAFTNARKRLVLMDRSGAKREVDRVADVLLPAWSDAGRHLAFLCRKDKKKLTVMVMEVAGQ